jgi:hypothetical protein
MSAFHPKRAFARWPEDLLECPISRARPTLSVPPIRDKMAMLEEVDLGYVMVGQQDDLVPATCQLRAWH